MFSVAIAEKLSLRNCTIRDCGQRRCADKKEEFLSCQSLYKLIGTCNLIRLGCVALFVLGFKGKKPNMAEEVHQEWVLIMTMIYNSDKLRYNLLVGFGKRGQSSIVLNCIYFNDYTVGSYFVLSSYTLTKMVLYFDMSSWCDVHFSNCVAL